MHAGLLVCKMQVLPTGEENPNPSSLMTKEFPAVDATGIPYRC